MERIEVAHPQPGHTQSRDGICIRAMVCAGEALLLYTDADACRCNPTHHFLYNGLWVCGFQLVFDFIFNCRGRKAERVRLQRIPTSRHFMYKLVKTQYSELDNM